MGMVMEWLEDLEGKAEQLVGIAADIKQLKIIQIQSDKSCR